MPQHVAERRQPSGLGTLERSMSVGYGAIAAILLFSVGGYVLDRWLGTSPWLFIVGIVVGLSLAFFAFGGLIQNRMSRR
ncbi:MAG TPA: AtpZ/AtpI family protein [Vicinamibacterales bacterium]